MLGACAGNTPPPTITYDAAAFKPAAIATRSRAGQIRRHAAVAAAATAAAARLLRSPIFAPPTARVDAAQIAPRCRSRRPSGYINAVQIYPFSDSALYRLYAAPQQVSDIALQPGETLSAISAGDTVRWAVGDTASGTGAARRSMCW